MRFGHLEILCSDLAASRRFYEEVLGFRVTAVQGERFTWLDAGGVEILLRPGTSREATRSYEEGATGLVLYTDALEMRLAELKSRGLQIRGTVDGPDCPTFTDPDGNWFQLVDPEDHS